MKFVDYEREQRPVQRAAATSWPCSSDPRCYRAATTTLPRSMERTAVKMPGEVITWSSDGRAAILCPMEGKPELYDASR